MAVALCVPGGAAYNGWSGEVNGDHPDLDGSGSVDAGDVASLLLAFGGCP